MQLFFLFTSFSIFICVPYLSIYLSMFQFFISYHLFLLCTNFNSSSKDLTDSGDKERNAFSCHMPSFDSDFIRVISDSTLMTRICMNLTFGATSILIKLFIFASQHYVHFEMNTTSLVMAMWTKDIC